MSSDHKGCERDIQDCSGAISSQFTREHQTHEQTEAAPGGISSAVGKCRLQKKAGFTEVSQLAASAGLSTQVSQTTTFLNEQLCPA